MNQPELRRVGKYEIIGLLGDGGMARVYRARMQGMARATKNVALKLIHSHLVEDRDFVLMFLDEMRLAMALEHRNIVQTFDAGHCQEGYYLVMELVEGATLGSLLNAISGRELMPLELCLFIAMEVCAALDFAHNFRWGGGRGANVVHRDVSPSNILLSRQGDVKLADFGVAKAVGGLAMSQVRSIKGKLSYMAPEQARGESGRRSDLFSVGAVLYEMIAGRPLRRDVVPLGRIADGSGEIPWSSTSLRPGLSRTLELLLRACLAADPLRRPKSAEEIRAALAEELFRCQLEGGSVLDAHAGLRGYLAANASGASATAARGEGGTVDRLARALLEVAQESGSPSATSFVEPADPPTLRQAAASFVEPADPPQQGPAGAIFDADATTEEVSAPAAARPISLLDSGLLPLDQAGTRALPSRRNLGSRPLPSAAAAGAGSPLDATAPVRFPASRRRWFVVLGLLGAVAVAGTITPLVARRAKIQVPPSAAGSQPLASRPADASRRARAASTSQPRAAAASAPSSQAAAEGTDVALRFSPLTVERRLPGRLSVSSRPSAFVYIDGTRRGATPLEDLELAPGSHQLRLVNPTLHRSLTLRLQVRPGERLRRSVDLR